MIHRTAPLRQWPPAVGGDGGSGGGWRRPLPAGCVRSAQRLARRRALQPVRCRPGTFVRSTRRWRLPIRWPWGRGHGAERKPATDSCRSPRSAVRSCGSARSAVRSWGSPRSAVSSCGSPPKLSSAH